MHNIRTADELKAICSRVSEEFRSKRRVLSFAEYLDLFVTDPGRHSRDAAAYVRGAFDHYGNKEVGKWLWDILSVGATSDWRQLIKEKTGEDLSSRAMLDYFKPLLEHLKKENGGQPPQWQ